MSDFPVLVDLGSQQRYPLGQAEKFIVGRSREANVPVLDVSCSRQQFQIVHREGKYFLEALSTTTPTILGREPVRSPVALSHAAIIQAGHSRFQFFERPEQLAAKPSPPAPAEDAERTLTNAPDSGERPGFGRPSADGDAPAFAPGPQFAQPAAFTPPPPAPPPPLPASGVDMTMMAGSFEAPAAEVLRDRIPLSDYMLFGREVGKVQVPLQHAHVSRIHAQLVRQQGRCILSDLRSANGTFVNGQPIAMPTLLKPGDLIDIGPYTLQFTGTMLLPRSRENNVELVCRKLSRIVKDRHTGKDRRLLDDITLVVRPREFVALLGPSGSGKSTLLSALSGRTRAEQGDVQINQQNLYTNFEVLKQDMVVVPQKDVLHDSLRVEQALWYTAKLRLPADTKASEVGSALDRMLDVVHMNAHRRTTIKDLSGGQIKRVSLANELLAQPTLLFLDEVTSGLDEQTDREMMQLFRTLAENGKTVVCVTHNLANIERNCHLVAILTTGGKLAFYGAPGEALQYFKIERLGDVYEKLAEESTETWQSRYRASPFYHTYIESRLPPDTDHGADHLFVKPVSVMERVESFGRQAWLLMRRYVSLLSADPVTLLTLFGQSLLVALLLILLFGNIDELENKFVHARNATVIYFLLGVSCFWFGCNNAAKEIVKERVIFSRERDFNLQLGSYYVSKFLPLALLTCLQTLALYGLVAFFCQPPSTSAKVLVYLIGLSTTGVALGLAISAWASSEDGAVTLIPMALIPQIILADVIAPLEDWSKRLAEFAITMYWGNEGLRAILPQDVADLVPLDLDDHSAAKAITFLGVHAIVFIVVGFGALLLKDPREPFWKRLARPK